MTLSHVRPDILATPEEPYGLVDLADVAARHGLPLDRIVKLDANENLYGPSPRVQAALAADQAWQFYPDISYLPLRRALGEYVGADPEQIIATNGCDELIQLLVQLFVQPGDQAINTPPTFSVYDWAIHVQDGKKVTVPRLRDDGYALDTKGIVSAVNERTRLVFICNPNNPTGNLTPQKEIEAILDTGIMVAVDETYYEFCGVSMLPLMARYSNLIIMRSLSKWAALAGMRVGYGVFHSEVARQMHKIRQPFNVNRAGNIAALASIEDKDYLLANVAKLVAERERLLNMLRAVPYLHCYPSHGNYILCDVDGASSQVLRDEIEKEGVLLRAYQSKYLPNAIRFSVGKPEHSEAAMSALHSAGRRLKLR
jgi:histidinol-phosphate aminotransferase